VKKRLTDHLHSLTNRAAPGGKVLRRQLLPN
jgi:hypothetical protein